MPETETYDGLFLVRQLQQNREEEAPPEEPQTERSFRGIRERTLDDQLEAARLGYPSVVHLAIDKLAGMVIDLQARVGALEGTTEVVEGDPED